MALPKFEDDLAFISKLGDYPGSDNNLTPEQFRERFDMAALLIQEYLNNQLVPGLDQLVDVQALLNGILDSTLSLADKAANAKATGDALSRKLDKTGGNVTGNIDMGGKRITNLGTPINDEDVATKGYVDNKTQDLKATIPTSGWQTWTDEGNAFGYVDIHVDGISNSDDPIFDYDGTSTASSTDVYRHVEWLNTVYKVQTFANRIRVFATEVPTEEIPVKMKVVR